VTLPGEVDWWVDRSFLDLLASNSFVSGQGRIARAKHPVGRHVLEPDSNVGSMILEQTVTTQTPNFKIMRIGRVTNLVGEGPA
jgi:hypothetical protein